MNDVKSIGDRIARLNRAEAAALAKYLEGLDPPAGSAALVPVGGPNPNVTATECAMIDPVLRERFRAGEEAGGA
jgi:hypothetical protein